MKPAYRSIRRALLALVVLLAVGASSLNAQWTELPALPYAASLAMSVWHNGYLYQFGGNGTSGVTAESRKMMVPGGSWSSIAPLPEARRGGFAAVVEGKIYILGGSGTAGQLLNIVEYDPATNSYSTKGVLGKGAVQCAGAVQGSSIYIISGLYQNGANYYGSNAVQIYDVLTNVVQEINPSPLTGDMGGAVASGSTIYLVGGRDATGTSKLAYKGALNGSLVTWTKIADYPTAAYSVAGGDIAGKPYFAAGVDGNAAMLKSVYSYNAATNKWEASYALPTATAFNNAMPGDGTHLYYVGGNGNAKVFKLTLGTPNPIAELDRTQLVITVKKGQQKQAVAALRNLGVAPLTGTITIPDPAKPWLQTQNANITVQPGSAMNISFNANATSLDLGSYNADVMIATNDPDHASLSLAITVYVVPSDIKTQPTNLVIEEASGDWCGPCGAYGVPGMRALKEQYGENLIALSHHDRGGRTSEAMYTTETEAINGWLGVPFFPAASFQRYQFAGEASIMVGTGSWNNAASAVYTIAPTAPIALEVTKYSYNTGTKTATAELTITTAEALSLPAGTTFRVTAMATEDSIQLPQASAPESPFYHMDVTRDIWPDIYGQEINVPPDALDNGGTILIPGKTFTIPVTFSNVGKVARNAYAHMVFFVHLNYGSRPGPILQGQIVKLTANINGGGGTGGYAVNTKVSYLAVEANKDTAKFDTYIKNNSAAPMNFTVSRPENNINGAWSSWYCFNSDCAAPGDNGPVGPYSIAPGDSAHISLYVRPTSAATGTVKLSFNAPDGTKQEQLYTVMATPGASGAVPFEALTGETLQLSFNTPNPASNLTRFNFSNPTAGVVSVEVFSVTGVKVMSLPARAYESGVRSFDLDVSGLPNGVYSVRLSTDGKSVQSFMTVAR